MTVVGDTVMPGALGRSDFPQSAPLAFGPSLRRLEEAVGPHGLLAPGHDYEQRMATTLSAECAVQPLLSRVLRGAMEATEFAAAKSALEQHLGLTEYQTVACGARVDCAIDTTSHELEPGALHDLLQAGAGLVLVDVREPYEQRMSSTPDLGPDVRYQAVPMSRLLNALPGWLALPAETPVLFFCRSGNRSAQAAKALRRLGHVRAWSLAGGLALWPKTAPGMIDIDLGV
jgi:rhodanese-related sulfurtransferase